MNDMKGLVDDIEEELRYAEPSYRMELLERALTALKAQGWQPISTAPRDETEILVSFWNSDAMGIAYWDAQAPDTDRHWKVVDGPWYHDDAPTHWMPLPPSPNELKESHEH